MYSGITKSNVMRDLVVELCQKHEIPMKSGMWLKLNLGKGFMPISIEMPYGDNRVSVTHWYELNGDQCKDPDMVFWIAPDGDWYAESYVQETPPIMVYHTELIEFEDEKPVRYMKHWQRDAAQFANQWARNLIEQGVKEAPVMNKTNPSDEEMASDD